MGWWKADPEPPKPASTPQQPASKSSSPPPQLNPVESDSACPVDPQTRSLWLQQAQRQSQAAPLPSSHPPVEIASSTFAATPSTECSSDRIDQSPIPSRPSQPESSSSFTRSLSHERVISSIPRASTQPTPTASSTPANSESETGPHTSGNWIYPSESQFFHAVLRKHSPESLPSAGPTESSLASTIPTIIPIHNAVNERAWSLIKTWEEPHNPPSMNCAGPKLHSFRGLGAGALSPKARWNSLLGYQAPFDRHDWVVERCDGTQVEYVIDFYQGKAEEGRKGNLNFYLDVRPKVNTFEGVRMRAERALGIGNASRSGR